MSVNFVSHYGNIRIGDYFHRICRKRCDSLGVDTLWRGIDRSPDKGIAFSGIFRWKWGPSAAGRPVPLKIHKAGVPPHRTGSRFPRPCRGFRFGRGWRPRVGRVRPAHEKTSHCADFGRRRKRDQWPVCFRRSSISSGENRFPRLIPGHRKPASAQSSGLSRFIGQNGQVRHWLGRTE